MVKTQCLEPTGPSDRARDSLSNTDAPSLGAVESSAEGLRGRHRQLVVLVAVSTEVRRGPFPDSRSIFERSA